MFTAEVNAPLIEKEVEAIVEVGCYTTKAEVVLEALRTLFEVKPVLRVAAAVELYRKGEVTLGRGAELAGMSFFEFEELLATKGLRKVIPYESAEKIERDVGAIHALRGDKRPC